MKVLAFLLMLFPLSALAAPDDSAGTIGAEWNNSTSVEFPATSTDAQGNVIYNFYNDKQYFAPTPPPETPTEEKKNPGEVLLDQKDQATGNDNAKGLLNDFSNVGGVTGNDESDFDFFAPPTNTVTLWTVVLSGSLIRDEAVKKGIAKITLKGFIPKKRASDISDWLPQTRGDLSIVAAAAIVHDANIIQVTLKQTTFTILYQVKGYLLYLIPWKYTVTVHVDSSANTVSVKYPWYEFFLWKPVTKATLETSIREVVSEVMSLVPDASAERQARLFGAVADVLKEKNTY